MFKIRYLKCYFKSYLSDLSLLQIRRKSSIVATDTLDTFTTQLMDKKSSKWEAIKLRQSNFNTILKNSFVLKHKEYLKEATAALGENSLKLSVQSISTEQIDMLFASALELNNINDVYILINQCELHNKSPSKEILLGLLSCCSTHGNKEQVQKLQRLTKIGNLSFYKSNAAFKHYLAEAIWIEGNIEEALKIFIEVYDSFLNLRQKVRFMLKCLIAETVANRSEASLVVVTKFAILFSKIRNDFYPLSFVWENCFLSEWFADQYLASNLLKENKGIKEILETRVFTIAITALKSHQVETVHRLLEQLLAEDMKLQYVQVIHALFDYKCWQNDLRGCSEIIRSSMDLNITLNSAQHVKFLQMLIGGNHKTPLRSRPLPKPPQFQMKF